MNARTLLAALALPLSLAACHAPEAAAPQPQSVAGTIHLCSSCHGLTGRSVSPNFPILAGQNAEYIATELKYFHNLTQDDRSVTHESWIAQWFINITATRSSYRYEDAPRNEPRAWDFMRRGP